MILYQVVQKIVYTPQNMTTRSDVQEKRRSQRLALQIPIIVEYFADDPGRLTTETTTFKISAHGAVLRLPWGVPTGREMLLQNSLSREFVKVTAAFVDHVEDGASGHGEYEVGVEFKEANPEFWGVSFPPDDWTPNHPDAKPTPQ